MLESEYQAGLIKRIVMRFPGCRIVFNQTNTPGYIQGFPDLTVYYGNHWALLEVKVSAKAKRQPNQEYYVDLYSKETFCSFIYPENEEEVLDALQLAFASCEHPRTTES